VETTDDAADGSSSLESCVEIWVAVVLDVPSRAAVAVDDGGRSTVGVLSKVAVVGTGMGWAVVGVGVGVGVPVAVGDSTRN
jgi:hypothetical protein